MRMLDRSQLTAVAALCLLLFACTVSVALSLEARWQAAAEQADRQDVLARLQARVHARNERPGASGPAVAPAEAVASARLAHTRDQLPGWSSPSRPGWLEWHGQRVSVPEGSCTGTGEAPVAMSQVRDQVGRMTGVCPVCGGRLRLDVDRLLPNHAPAPLPQATTVS